MVVSALKSARCRTAALLRGVEVPSVWTDATAQAALNAFSRTTKSAKASRRRLLEKTLRLDEVGR